MTFQFKHIDKIIGAFVLLSIALLLGSIIFIIFNKNIFTKKYVFSTKFEDAYGLKINQNILYKGIKIGKVKNFNINKDFNVNQPNIIDVEFFIYKTYIKIMRENSVINKSDNPISGSTITIMPNLKNNEIAKEHSFIYSMDSSEGKLLAGLNEIEKKTDDISNIIENVNLLLTALNSDHNEQDSSIARILVNTADIVESMKGELKYIDGILYNFKELSNNMRTPDNLVKRMIDPDGEVLFNSLDKSMDNLEIMMEQLAEFSKFINNKSADIDTLLVESKITMKEAQDVIEGIKNNPLIKGGITDKKQQETSKESIRDRVFE